ncbi:MAG: SDR family oxidoreductase [Nitrospirota bacterium]|nr:SDR family oxidoreductase [Nitrospirota bacterium]
MSDRPRRRGASGGAPETPPVERDSRMINLSDRVVILTGSSSPVGEAIARQLVQVGARVVLGYNRRLEVIDRLMKDLEPMEGVGMPYSVDVASRRSVDAMMDYALEQFGRVDTLIHNANAPIDRHPFLQRTWEDYETQLEVMLKGAFNTTQAVLEEMILRREGRIVFILNAMMERPVPGYSAYTTAVAATKGFARDLANEVGELGINVNAISPGFTLTPETPHAPARVQKALAAQTPLRRLAQPEDIARAALFFCSDLSSFVTGEDLTLDGGYHFGYTGPFSP